MCNCLQQTSVSDVHMEAFYVLGLCMWVEPVKLVLCCLQFSHKFLELFSNGTIMPHSCCTIRTSTVTSVLLLNDRKPTRILSALVAPKNVYPGISQLLYSFHAVLQEPLLVLVFAGDASPHVVTLPPGSNEWRFAVVSSMEGRVSAFQPDSEFAACRHDAGHVRGRP